MLNILIDIRIIFSNQTLLLKGLYKSFLNISEILRDVKMGNERLGSNQKYNKHETSMHITPQL